MSILKESKSLDDRSIKEDTPYEKWADRFPTDQYRTFATHVPMFEFRTKTSPILQWKVDDVSKWFKNPTGLPIASAEKVPFTHYNLTINEPAKVDKDVFGNNIINNQKDIKADYMNRTLPEKYVYGLDRKGQGDLAYEQLDIEGGDDNALSRAREEFYEQYYLQEEHGLNLSDLQNETKTLKKEITQGKGSDKKIAQLEANENIMVETIPQLLGKNAEEQDDNKTANKYLKLKYKTDRQLTKKEIVDVNRIFRGYGLRPVPFGSYSHAVAMKLNERLSDALGDNFHRLAERELDKKKIPATRRKKNTVVDQLQRTTKKIFILSLYFCL